MSSFKWYNNTEREVVMKEEANKIDMHTHSCYSDGDLTPTELIDLAAKNNIKTLSITDHDTIDGIKRVKSESHNIEIFNGVELTALRAHGRMHILGYGIDLDNEDLNKKMIELKDNSINSVLSVMEQIKRDYGIRFSYEDIKTLINSNKNIGRHDIAKLCVKYGYARTKDEAFKRYLIDAYDKTKTIRKGISYEECLDVIIKSGGIPVLAHPKSLELNEKDFLMLLRDMIKCGLEGIEVFHSTHSKEQMKYYKEVAEHYNLLISGGSDYHGISVKPSIEIGTGKNNNLNIKTLSLVDRLHDR